MKWIDKTDQEIEVECKDITEAETTLARACHLLDAAAVQLPDCDRKQEVREFFIEIKYTTVLLGRVASDPNGG